MVQADHVAESSTCGPPHRTHATSCLMLPTRPTSTYRATTQADHLAEARGVLRPDGQHRQPRQLRRGPVVSGEFQ